MKTPQDIIYDYAMTLVTTPYKWGGSNFAGLDCSGLVILLLQAAGVFPYHQDASAADLAKTYGAVPFAKDGVKFGTLLFYGDPIFHVTFALNEYQMVSASGGDHETVSVEDARLKNAFVKVLALSAHGAPRLMATPKYPW